MDPVTKELRELLASHETADNWRLFRMALDLIDKQQNSVDWLRHELLRQSQVTERQGEALVRLGKEIDRLKGVHGA